MSTVYMPGLLGWLFSFLLPLSLSLDDGEGGGGGGGEGEGTGGGGEGSSGSSGAGSGASGGGSGTGQGSGGNLFSGAGKGQGNGTGGQGGGQGQGQGSSQAAGGDPWYVGLYTADGKIDAKKFDALPEHLKPHRGVFEKYQTVEALLGGMANLANLAGKKALAPLPENATPEAKAERAALMRSLNGVPETPDGYNVKRPADVPQEYWSDAYVGGVLGILHKHNASPQLVQELIAFDTGITKQNMAKAGQNEVQSLAAEQAALRKEFGPQYDDKLDLAQRAARTLGLQPDDPLFRNHKMVVAMARVGEMISEDRLVSGDGPSGDTMSDRQKARDIVNNAANPLHKAYHDANDPRHDEALRMHSEFNKRASAVARTRR
jgi:hypothetical protein